MTDINADGSTKISDQDYIDLNAKLNFYDADGKIQFEADKEATRQYFLQHVNPKTRWFHSLEEKYRFLIDNDYYDEALLKKYDFDFIKQLMKKVYAHKFRFSSFVGAYKFYVQYALKSRDGEQYLERIEERIVMVALGLADGDTELATAYAEEMITGRLQPATPTFLSYGKVSRGELVSCFLVNTFDSMESISKTVDASLQLSKRGGGVGINLSNLREAGAPIKGIENAASGVVPVMKILEDSFSYSNQLG